MSNINKQKFCSFFKKLLDDSHITQTELAKMFGVTQPAISKMLGAKSMPSTEQLQKLSARISEEQYKELIFFYSKAKYDEFSLNDFNDFIGGLAVELSKNIPGKVHEVKISEDLHEVPVISFAQAAGYEPALEPFDDFARDCSDEKALFRNIKPGYFALDVDGDSMSPEYPHGSILLVAGGEYPQRGDVVVAKLRDGQVVVKTYSRKDSVIKLQSENPDGMNFSWNCKEDPGFVQWMYPVIEVTIKLRTRRWERVKNGNH
jgi:SOS-response transcriptional repressor LexA